jgi:hypothetical protein
MVFRRSSKTSAHRAAENTEGNSRASWQCTSSEVSALFRKDWIHKSPKSTASSLSPRPRIKWLLPLWLSQRTTPRDVVHSERRANLCNATNFSEIPEMALKNVLINWTTRLSWVKKNVGEYSTKKSGCKSFSHSLTSFSLSASLAANVAAMRQKRIPQALRTRALAWLLFPAPSKATRRRRLARVILDHPRSVSAFVKQVAQKWPSKPRYLFQ